MRSNLSKSIQYFEAHDTVNTSSAEVKEVDIYKIMFVIILSET